MPHAEDYDAAADALDTAAQTAGTLLEPARATLAGDVMIGGRLTGQVADGLDAASVILDQVTAELTQLAATCRERAETCRNALTAQQTYTAAYTDYEADLRDWQDVGAHGTQPQPPTAPEPLPSWATVS
jgi:hypothetical protein